MTNLLFFDDDLSEYLYRVGKNETLTEISFKFNIPVSEIIRVNSLDKDISCGDVLVLRPMKNCKIYYPCNREKDFVFARDGKNRDDGFTLPFTAVKFKK